MLVRDRLSLHQLRESHLEDVSGTDPLSTAQLPCHADHAAELLGGLADDRVLGTLSGLHLAARELPASAGPGRAGTTRSQHPAATHYRGSHHQGFLWRHASMMPGIRLLTDPGHTVRMDGDVGVHLVRGADRGQEVDGLANALEGRVGLSGVLADLNHDAPPARVPGRAVTWGFRWDEEDEHSRRWWPQGITTSADRDRTDHVDGRRVVLTSAYSKQVAGVHKGARISVIDVTDRSHVRYRHVLLVEAYLDSTGSADLRPVKLHAGGIVWHGPYLHVAGTTRGMATFRLDDIVAAPVGGAPDRIGRGTDGRLGTFGYRYVLPVRFAYEAHTRPGVEQLRYSFLSLGRGADRAALVAGEYGRDGMTTRLVHFPIDPQTSLLRSGADDEVTPRWWSARGLSGMQGAAVVNGTYYVTTSAGRHRRGSLWVGTPGAFRRRRWALPVGPEDITYWPATDELWSLSEHPGRRFVFAMDRGRVR
jgi:hypothetical protein